jgi:uncharacterized protein YbjT (DUF2867 family)
VSVDPILVTGATGPHGNAVVRALLGAGHRVRALTRDPSSGKARQLAEIGAEPVGGDLLDLASLVAAMGGVEAVYGVTTPFGGAGAEQEVEQGRQLIAAGRRVGLEWLILASVGSADRDTEIPHFVSKGRIEELLLESPIPHTIVAPTYFYENLGDPAELAAAGELALALPPDKPLQQIGLADLGAIVAAVVARREEFVGERLELAVDAPTPVEMADAITDASGRSVSYRQLGIADVAARSADLAAMYRFLGAVGYQADIAAVRARFPELALTPFAGWVQAQLIPFVL